MRLDQNNIAASFREIEREDLRNQKRGQEYEPERLILKDTVTGTRYVVTIASGSLTLTAL